MFGRKGEKCPFFGIKRPYVSEVMKQKVGELNPMFGKKNPYLTNLNKQRIGDKHPLWKGGISLEPYGPEFNKELKEYIREKFNHICLLCKKFAKIPHHVDYNKKNNQEDNFALLCGGCNATVNHNRDQWEIGFKIFISGSQECQKQVA